jgi:hypothetical protein
LFFFTTPPSFETDLKVDPQTVRSLEKRARRCRASACVAQDNFFLSLLCRHSCLYIWVSDEILRRHKSFF